MAKGKKDGWAGTPDEWARRAGPHNVTLKSGQRATINVLGLVTLGRLEALPESLSEVAWLHYANLTRGGAAAAIESELRMSATDPQLGEKAVKHMRDLNELYKLVVAEALVDPVMTVEQLSDPQLVPEQDLEQLFRLCTGQEPFDSAGIRMGVEPVEAWATFRDQHGCTEDCEGCSRALGQLSTVYVGAL